MTAALLLWTLAWGYWAAEAWHLSRRRAVKGQGHPQYFLATMAAGVLLLMALGSHTVALHADWYRALVSSEGLAFAFLPSDGKGSGKAAATLAPTLLWAPLLAVFVPWLLNAPLRRNARLSNALAYRLSHSEPFDDFVVDSNLLEIPIMVTLKSGKVYVGHPVVTFDAPQGNMQGVQQWLRIRPTISGHRDQDHNFVPVNDYADVRRASVDGHGGNWLPVEAFDVVLPMSEITSAHPMDLIAYMQFRAAATSLGQPARRQELDRRLQDLVSESWQLVQSRKKRWENWKLRPTLAMTQYSAGALALLAAFLSPLVNCSPAASLATAVAALVLLYRSGSPDGDEASISPRKQTSARKPAD